MTLFGHFQDHYSPITSSAEPSSVSSPVILKPPFGFPSHKPRSSLMNSLSLNHSVVVLGGGHQSGGVGVANGTITPSAATPNLRSMSVVSLESPRNSIALTEDSRMTRNNSNTSLVSLSNQPLHNYQNSKPIPLKVKDGLTLDDSFHLDETPTKLARPILKPRLKTRDIKLDNIKQDFRLNYDLLETGPGNTPLRLLEAPSPLSLNMDKMGGKPSDYKYERNHVHFNLIEQEKCSEGTSCKEITHINTNSNDTNTNTRIDTNNSDTNSDYNPNVNTTNEVTKKKKSNSMQQSIILKKKMIYSKDLQLELNQSLSSSLSMADSKYITPTTLLENSNSNTIKQPVFETLTQKNKLIRQLNQKWNKSSEKELKSSAKLTLKPSLNFHVLRKRRFLSDDEISDYDTGFL